LYLALVGVLCIHLIGFLDGELQVKCTLVQAMRFCTSLTGHRGSRVIAVLIHDHGTRRG
jgi:hypothetical protein